MHESDLDQVANIERQVSPHPWSKQQFADSLSPSRHHCIILSADGITCGYLVFSQVVDEAEILNIAVDPQFQGRGLGRNLLEYCQQAVADKAQRLFLEVRASNNSARQLYESSGFAEVCVRHNYYQTSQGSEDAILMAMELF